MLKRIVLAATFTCLIAAAPAFAQQPATLVLRSGERIAGDLIDLGGSGFAIRVNGQDRQIATDQVAVVEFSGGDLNADMRNRLNAGQHFAVLRDGQIVEGRLADIGGSNPLRLHFQTPSGTRDLSSNDVARIYFANPSSGGSNAVATTGSGTITVPGNQEWVDTNITVNGGDRLRVSSTGQVRFGANREHQSTAAGARLQRGPNAPLPTAPLGALIGRIDEGQPFLIGGNTTVTVPATGKLFLRVNDDIVTDNSGAFQVTIGR